MASLVADYGTSSGEDSGEEDSVTKNPKDGTEAKPAVNYLLGSEALEDENSASDTDNSVDSQDHEQVDSHAQLPNPMAKGSKLPLPNLGKKTAKTKLKHSVFVTDFHKAEAVKDSILQQHVKMTTADLRKERDGRKVCWNFRKGRCLQGSKCRYAHDNDIAQRQEKSQEDQGGAVHDSHSYYGNRSAHAQISASTSQNDDDSFDTEQKQRKKRAGISDQLVPPKKAMKPLLRQREEERPWTTNT